MKKETADMKLWLRISDYNWDLDVRLGKRFGPRDIPLWKLALLQEASIGRVADAADLYPGLELPSKPALVEPQGWEYHDLRIASRLEALFTAADAEAQAEAQVQFADSEGGVVGGAGGGGGMGAAGGDPHPAAVPERPAAVHRQSRTPKSNKRRCAMVPPRVPSTEEGSIIDTLMAQVTTAGNNSEGSMLEAVAHEWDLQFYRNYDRK